MKAIATSIYADVMDLLPRIVEHAALTRTELTALRALFDREYRSTHGAWDPDLPYGYSPAATHVIVFDTTGSAVAHVGFQPREIAAGGRPVLVAGTGGVLVDDRVRGRGLGAFAMTLAQDTMRSALDLEFGYLGCREGVVPFYERTGWKRIHVTERSTPRSAPSDTISEAEAVVEEGTPVLIYPLRSGGLTSWPTGEVDLRGRAW